MLFFLTVQKGGADQTGQMGGPGRADGFGENVITASGSTSVGMQEETFDLDYIETGIENRRGVSVFRDEVEEGNSHSEAYGRKRGGGPQGIGAEVCSGVSGLQTAASGQ